MLNGRPRKARLKSRNRTKAFGHAAKGARTPAQIRAGLARNRLRGRSTRR